MIVGVPRETKPDEYRGARLPGGVEGWGVLGNGEENTLLEMLTMKSDDIVGPTAAFDAIVKGERITHSHTPAAFNVLLAQLRGLSLDVQLTRSVIEDKAV